MPTRLPPYVCPFCGNTFRARRRDSVTCSRSCAASLREKRARERDPDRNARTFWSHVEKTDGCWLWHGVTNKLGYGLHRIRPGGQTPAHRFSYQIARGPIPAGLVIDHLCRVHNCVNPDHLRAVTNHENLFAPGSLFPGKLNALKTHCIRGHEFTSVNTYINRYGRRNCRACHAQWEREYRMRRRLNVDADRTAETVPG